MTGSQRRCSPTCMGCVCLFATGGSLGAVENPWFVLFVLSVDPLSCACAGGAVPVVIGGEWRPQPLAHVATHFLLSLQRFLFMFPPLFSPLVLVTLPVLPPSPNPLFPAMSPASSPFPFVFTSLPPKPVIALPGAVFPRPVATPEPGENNPRTGEASLMRPVAGGGVDLLPWPCRSPLRTRDRRPRGACHAKTTGDSVTRTAPLTPFLRSACVRGGGHRGGIGLVC